MDSSIERGQPLTIAAFGRDTNLYFLCQVLGWSLYAILLSIVAISLGQTASGAVLVSAVWSGTALIGTHVFRTYTKDHPWRTLPQLAVRLALAVTLISAVVVAAQTAASQLYWRFTGENDPRHSAILIHVVQAATIVVVWCTLYLGIQEFRRRRATEVEALRLALVAQVAQLRTLRSQLNPHFLFNCLNGLRELIREDPERAERVITELAGLLRYTLEADRVETVPLSDEMHAVRQYLSLEKVRFEERLRLRIEIGTEALQVQVPPMLVQALAENALKHGIARLAEGGELAIEAHANGQQLEIVVTNPGSVSSGGSPTGVGLENARERLRLVYGGAASLALLDNAGQVVEARVTIPLTTEKT